MGNSSRICVKCGKSKELTSKFFRECLSRSKVPLYFRKKCIDCERVESCEWQRQHTEHAKERNRKFYEKNPNYKNDWKLENSDHIKEYRAKYESQTRIKLRKEYPELSNTLLRSAEREKLRILFHFCRILLKSLSCT